MDTPQRVLSPYAKRVKERMHDIFYFYNETSASKEVHGIKDQNEENSSNSEE